MNVFPLQPMCLPGMVILHRKTTEIVCPNVSCFTLFHAFFKSNFNFGLVLKMVCIYFHVLNQTPSKCNSDNALMKYEVQPFRLKSKESKLLPAITV